MRMKPVWRTYLRVSSPLFFEGTLYPTMYPKLTVAENDYLLFDKDVRLHIFERRKISVVLRRQNR